jgi:hypothetical protein
MFDFFKRWKQASPTLPTGRAQLSAFLNQVASVSLTPGGLKDLRDSHALKEFLQRSSGILPAESLEGLPLAKHIVFSLVSGYSVAETVLHAYKLELALRVTRAGNDIDKLTQFPSEVLPKLERFKEWRDAGLIRPEFWANDVSAIFHMTNLSAETEKWLRQVTDEFSKLP